MEKKEKAAVVSAVMAVAVGAFMGMKVKTTRAVKPHEEKKVEVSSVAQPEKVLSKEVPKDSVGKAAVNLKPNILFLED